MKRLAVFDCDGTLIDSQANICVAMEQAFAASNLVAPNRAAIRRIVGLSLIDAVAVLLPDADAALHRYVVADYKRAFHGLRASGQLDEPLFDGIAAMLADLQARGWLLGIATGKSDRGLAHALEAHNLADCFVTLQTADRHPSKPHPSMVSAAMAEAGVGPDTTVVIGDTSFDMMMARRAGARAVGVAWGYHPVRELTDAGAEAIAQRPSALVDILGAA
jgi:phosphoglycolate phosphatase